MRKTALIALIIFFAIFNLCAQNKSSSKENLLENKIIDTILNLPEVRAGAMYIEKKTKGKRHLETVIYMKPDKNQPYYWVKVWEDNGDSYVSWYNFYVYPKTMIIKYPDTVNHKLLDLETWRKSKDHTVS